MKYNRSNIARRANALARSMSRSTAWRKAWAEEKLAVAESALFVLRMKDRMSGGDHAEAARLGREITDLRKAIQPLCIVEAPHKANLEPLFSDEYAALCRKYAGDTAALRRLQRAYQGYAGLDSISDLRGPAPVFEYAAA